jgi:hypothetical protein
MLPNQSIISQNIKGLSVSFLFFSLLSTLSPKVLEDQKEGAFSSCPHRARSEAKARPKLSNYVYKLKGNMEK